MSIKTREKHHDMLTTVDLYLSKLFTLHQSWSGSINGFYTHLKYFYRKIGYWRVWEIKHIRIIFFWNQWTMAYVLIFYLFYTTMTLKNPHVSPLFLQFVYIVNWQNMITYILTERKLFVSVDIDVPSRIIFLFLRVIIVYDFLIWTTLMLLQQYVTYPV